MRSSVVHRLGLMMLVLAAAPCAALAQNSNHDSASPAYASASPPSNPTDEPATATDNPPTPDESALLGPALTFDPSMLSNIPAKTLRLPSQTIPQGFDIKTTEKSGGLSTIVMKQPLPYDAQVGADLGVASNVSDGYYGPGRPLPGSRNERSSGAAGASLGVVPDFATVDARLDPTNDQSKLGTTFKHAMAIGSNFSVTLQNSYSITEAYGTAPAGPSDLPLMTAPATTPSAPQVWGSEKGAKFDVLPTGTSFGAKWASTSIDPVTHNELSADQKLYGPLHVTTAVTDLGQPTRSKSISAGLKLNW